MSKQWTATMKRTTLAIVALAGAWTLFHIGWHIAGKTTDDYWGFALLVLFVMALFIALAQFCWGRSHARRKTVATTEQLPSAAITKFFLGSETASGLWFVLRMEVGAQWLLSGWAKIISPSWGTSGKALSKFATEALAKTGGTSPAVQTWYAWFLQHIVQTHLGLFSFLVTYGEFAVGLGVLLGILTGIAATFGVLMNLNYLLAGSVSLNPILGAFGLFLVLSWRVCSQFGGDRWVLPALGLPWKPGNLFQSHRVAVSSVTTADAVDDRQPITM